MKVISFKCSEVQDTLNVIKVCVYSGFKVFTGIIELEDTDLDVAAITFAEQVAEQNGLKWYDFEIQEMYKNSFQLNIDSDSFDVISLSLNKNSWK